MRSFVILALLGFVAQLVDGALGMAYGATSSTLLVGVAGLPSAVPSTAVHLGGWGPISTPTLLSSGRMEPRKVIGTVDTSEFIVAVCASVGFFFALSFAEVPWNVVGALLVGGVIAAPIAAYVVRILPTRILGTAVGGLILVTNMRTFLGAIGLRSDPVIPWLIYTVIVAIWAAALVFAIQMVRRERSAVEQPGEG